MKILGGTSRIVAAIMMIAILLFSQLAVASYVCPDLDAAISSPNSEHGTHPNDCPNQSDELPNLCQAHCEPDSQSAHTVQVPPVRAFVAAGLTVVICNAYAVLFVQTRERSDSIVKRTTSPPLAIRNCCFRI